MLEVVGRQLHDRLNVVFPVLTHPDRSVMRRLLRYLPGQAAGRKRARSAPSRIAAKSEVAVPQEPRNGADPERAPMGFKVKR